MKINIYKSIYNFQETNTNFLENLESLNDDNYELLNDKELVSDSNELKLIPVKFIYVRIKSLCSKSAIINKECIPRYMKKMTIYFRIRSSFLMQYYFSRR